MISLVAIQRAAVRTFAERGYAATTIRDIAAVTGVTSGALYLHVSSKMEVLESVMHVALDELLRMATLATSAGRILPEAHRRAMVAKRDAYERLWTEMLAAASAAATSRSTTSR